MSKRKVLLMGKSGAGKTSMRSIIFANYIARDTSRLGPTIEVEHSNVRFLGNLVLNLWDCGGQEMFMENYLASQKDQIFKNVAVLIYVFDVESREFDRDLKYYQTCVESLLGNSPNAQVFCLIHKMDLIPEPSREQVFKEKQEDILRVSQPSEAVNRSAAEIVKCFKSSIWDETLYKAWSAIIYQLIPNVRAMEEKLKTFMEITDADEALLFERTTFLVIAHAEQGGNTDSHRFEKVSNIIKQFKLSCSKVGSTFEIMHVHNKYFSAFIEAFTQNTYVMVVVSRTGSSTASTLMNIKLARKHFEELEGSV